MYKKAKVALGALALTAGLSLTLVANADTVTVKSGDTVSEIAVANNTTVSAIQSLNNLADVNKITVGQQLEVNTNSESVTSGTTNTSTSTTATTNTTNTTNTSAEEQAKAWIAQKESGNSYTAQNNSHYGKFQLDISYLKGDLSASNQEAVANAYVQERYGSWVNAKNFWVVHHYY